MVRFLVGAGDFSLLQSVQFGSAAHTVPCLILVGAGDFSLLQSVKFGSAAHTAPCLISTRHINGVVCKVIFTEIVCIVRVRTERISVIYLGQINLHLTFHVIAVVNIKVLDCL